MQLDQFQKGKGSNYKNSKPTFFDKHIGLSYCEADKTKRTWDENYDSLRMKQLT